MGMTRDTEKGLLRGLPWIVVLQGGTMLARRWASLSAKDRDRIRRLLSDSGGRIDRLTKKERRELTEVLGKLDLVGLGRELLPFGGRLRGRRGRGRVG
jgi:hypothetical protein